MLAWLPAFLPLYLLRFSVGPVPTNAMEMGVSIWAIITLAQHRTQILPRLRTLPKGVLIGSVLLLLAALVSTAIAQDTLSALGYLKSYILLPFLVATTVFTLQPKEAEIRRTLFVYLLTAAFLSLVALFEYLTKSGIPAPWDFENRATSLFPYPNAFGLFVAPATAYAFTLTLTERRRLTLPLAVIMLAGLVASKTEAALIAIPVAVIIATLLNKPRFRAPLIALSTIGIITLLALPFTRHKLLLQDYSGSVRLSQWNETSKLIKDHALLGVGLGEYPTALIPYHTRTEFEIFQYPHNILLNQWVELGLLGVIALLILIIALTSLSVRQQKNSLAMAIAASLLTMLVHGLVDVPFFKNDLSVLTALLISLFLVLVLDAKNRPGRTSTTRLG